MAEELEGELSDRDEINEMYSAFQRARNTKRPVEFALGRTRFKVNRDFDVGFKDAKEALSSPSAIEDLNRAVNAADDWSKTTMAAGSPEK